MRILLVLSLVLIVTGCGSGPDRKYTDYHLDEESFDAESLKMVEERTGIQLPEGSRGLNMFYEGSGFDPAFVAKVEIPVSSHEALAKRIEEIRHRRGSVIGSSTENVTWWKPSEATIQVERQFTHGNDYVRVLLCQENERWILYLEWITA